jgi:hypothetical protein
VSCLLGLKASNWFESHLAHSFLDFLAVRLTRCTCTYCSNTLSKQLHRICKQHAAGRFCYQPVQRAICPGEYATRFAESALLWVGQKVRFQRCTAEAGPHTDCLVEAECPESMHVCMQPKKLVRCRAPVKRERTCSLTLKPASLML